MKSKKESQMKEVVKGCSVGDTMEFLARPWTMHIFYVLIKNGPMRFGALRRAAEGISARLLTVRLRDLEAEGYVTRTVKDTSPPEVTYHPTEQLKDMQQVFELLHRLSDKWAAKREEIARAS